MMLRGQDPAWDEGGRVFTTVRLAMCCCQADAPGPPFTPTSALYIIGIYAASLVCQIVEERLSTSDCHSCPSSTVLVQRAVGPPVRMRVKPVFQRLELIAESVDMASVHTRLCVGTVRKRSSGLLGG